MLQVLQVSGLTLYDRDTPVLSFLLGLHMSFSIFFFFFVAVILNVKKKTDFVVSIPTLPCFSRPLICLFFFFLVFLSVI